MICTAHTQDGGDVVIVKIATATTTEHNKHTHHIYYYYLHDVARMMGENNYSFMSPPLHHSNTHTYASELVLF